MLATLNRVLLLELLNQSLLPATLNQREMLGPPLNLDQQELLGPPLNMKQQELLRQHLDLNQQELLGLPPS